MTESALILIDTNVLLEFPKRETHLPMKQDHRFFIFPSKINNRKSNRFDDGYRIIQNFPMSISGIPEGYRTLIPSLKMTTELDRKP